MTLNLPPSSSVPTNAVPLQKRTPAELRKNLSIDLFEGSLKDPADMSNIDILTAGRLIHDASQYLAAKAGVKSSLDRVILNDSKADKMNAVAWAEFHDDGKGEFHLGPMTTQDLVDGVRHLRTEPLAKWKPSEVTSFGEATSAVLHEIAHLTLPSYSEESLRSYNATKQTGIEEATAELTAMGRIPEFFKTEFAQNTPNRGLKVLQSTTSYATYTQRFAEIAKMAGNTTDAQLTNAAEFIGDTVAVKNRFRTLAHAVTTNLADGKEVPQVLEDEVAKTIPRFISELPSGRIRMQALLGPLSDIGAGHTVDVDDVLSRLKEIDDSTPKKNKPAAHAASRRWF